MGKPMTIEVAKFVVLAALIMMISDQLATGRAQKPESEPTWANTVINSKERQTLMQFYLHEVAAGESATAVEVVRAPGSNQTFSGFGYIAMLDDLIRVGPDSNSKLVGRAQGLDGSASQEEVSLITALTYTFSDGIYNGSSLSVLGRNSILEPVRELPVVGGTGIFRMARGYALIHTYSFDSTSGIVIVGYNVTVFH